MTNATESIPRTRPTTAVPERAQIIVRWIAALVLLVAAVMKADQIATEPMHGSGWQASRPLAVLLVEYEAILGFWLLSGLYVRASRATAITTFIAFFLFAGYEGWVGSPSCGCLGKAVVSPWLTAGIDALLVALLFATPANAAGLANLMPRFAIFTLGALLSLATIPTMLGVRALAIVREPEIMPDLDSYDFGIHKSSELLQFSHEFRIENRSNKPIRILKSTSSCRCTVAEVPNEPISPGGYALVRVAADWRGRYGSQTEHLLLVTDSATRASLELTVTATITSSAVFWPSVIDFGDVREGETVLRHVILTPGSDHTALHVLTSIANAAFIKVYPTSGVPKANGEQDWTIQLEATTPCEHNTAVARFTLDLPPTSNILSVPIRFSIIPAIRIIPRSLVFSIRQSDSVRTISISSSVEISSMAVVSEEMAPDALSIKTVSKIKTTDGWRYATELHLSRPSISKLASASFVASGDRFSSQIPIVLLP